MTSPSRVIAVGGEASYEVRVGRDLLGALDVPERRRALVHDAGLPRASVERAVTALSPEVDVEAPAGDACKTTEVWASALSSLARAALPRDAAVVSLGGGATTDLGGFVASTYLRGVAHYTLPTTLLGMVDAAVGGKTGLNLPEGKNLVGTFWAPRGVWCDVGFLETLPPRVFREGTAEVFKHGLLTDGALCGRVLAPDFGPHAADLVDVVADAVRVKADVVTRDPREAGERAFLNLGHTLAHALEAVTDHAVTHGEAVGYGLHYAAILSRDLGGADLTALTARFLASLAPAPLPTLSWEDVAPFVARDKKADSRGVRFVLLHDVGRPYLARVPDEAARAAFAAWRADVTNTPGAGA
ncbi:3-dehydroquinate synthase [Deinococcus pimensis]|uniref:3-dehydroquinate synthase n=1 Tax=Deinococcus pimensis TaxID=309888 RepID=UPI0004BC2D25|nr:3-dehydroquinate synthase family protein [Deinococcus pimensis]